MAVTTSAPAGIRADRVTLGGYITPDNSQATQAQKIELPLKAHPAHNFAYYVSPDLKPINFKTLSDSTWETIPSEQSRDISYSSSLKVSNVNNPFVFPDIKTYTIGTGRIMAMGANGLRMSEGQFGQYNLYVLTSLGVYSLDTGQDIAYTKQAPASLIIPTSDVICVTPFGLVFFAKNGLHVINGQNVEHLTPQLETRPVPLMLDLNLSGGTGGEISQIKKDWKKPFLDYQEQVVAMAYDPTEAELILINPEAPYNLVYNVQSKMWYQSTEEIDGLVENAQPNLLGVDGKRIVDFATAKKELVVNPDTLEEETVASKTMVSFITRPLNFGLHDLKRLDRVIIRSRLEGAQSVLAVSNNAIDDIEFALDKAVLLKAPLLEDEEDSRPANYKDVRFGIFTKKYRQVVIMFASQLDATSRIYSISAEVEKANQKMI